MNQYLQSAKRPDNQNHGFTSNDKRILVVEDDPDISHLLEIHLQDIAFKVDVVHNGIDGLNRASNHSYQLVVLDLMLPGLDGLELCRILRSQSITTPILMLTAKSSELDRVLGLELGADDYLTKPFSPVELLSRIKALSRRGSHLQTGRLSARHITFDPASRQVCKDGLPIDLFEREVQILELFIKNPGRVISQDELLSRAWPTDSETSAEAVRVAIYRLRSKIEHENDERPLIATIRGFGYRLDI